MKTSSNNNHGGTAKRKPPDEGTDHEFRSVLNRLDSIGDAPRVATEPFPDMRNANGGGPPHDIDRNPDDPADAIRNTAREVCDPEKIREYAGDFGTSLMALEPDEADHSIEQTYKGVTGVRSRAHTGPAKRAAGDQLKIETTTDADVKVIVANGLADGLKADRLEAIAIPRAQAEVDIAEREVAEREEAFEAANREVVRVETEIASAKDESRAGIDPDERPGGFWQWVRLSPRMAVLVAMLDILISTFVLEPAVGDLISTSIPYGSFLIALGLSTSLMVASGAAGVALAAIRLPGRVTGAIFLGIFTVVAFKFVGGMDALREGSESGVETLTACTLFAAYVAALTGYAAAAFQDAKEQRSPGVDIEEGSRAVLGMVTSVQAKAGEKLAEAKGRLSRGKDTLSGLLDEVEELRDSAARADGLGLKRESEGIAARTEAAVIDSVAKAGVEQERFAHEDWAVAVARAAYLKARAEKLPDPAQEVTLVDAKVEDDEQEDRKTGLSLLKKIAIGVLLAGLLAGIFLGWATAAVGAVLAGALLLLDRVGGRRRAAKVDAVPAEPEPEVPGSTIAPAAAEDSPFYYHQPSYMVPKYRQGESTNGDHQ